VVTTELGAEFQITKQGIIRLDGAAVAGSSSNTNATTMSGRRLQQAPLPLWSGGASYYTGRPPPPSPLLADYARLNACYRSCQALARDLVVSCVNQCKPQTPNPLG
jgi:hypothetical protein